MIEKQLLSYLFQPGLHQSKLIATLSPLHFEKEEFSNLLLTAQQLQKEGYPVTLHTILDKAELSKASNEEKDLIRDIAYTERDPDDFNFLLKEVENLALKKHILSSTTLIADVHNRVNEGLAPEEAKTELEDIWENYKYNTPDYQERDSSAKTMVEAAQKSKLSNFVDLSFGLPKLDRYTSYVTDSSLMILAATPGSGKTAFAVWLAETYTKRNLKVSFVSAEMGLAELSDRFYATYLGANAINMAHHRLNQRSLQGEALKKYQEAEKHFENNQNLFVFEENNLDHIENALRMQKLSQGKVDVIFIDHLHHIKNTGKFSSPVDQISDTVKRIKFLAQELKTPIILMAQFNRQIHGMKEPSMHQLKGSSTIEEVANKVFILNRKKPNKRQQQNKFKPKTGDPAVITLDKNREGLVGYTTVKYDLPTSSFFEIEDLEEDEDEN